MRYKKPKKVTSLVITDRDGMPVYNADTFRDAIRQTRDYVKWLLEELPPDYELRIQLYFCSGSLAVWREGLGFFTHN